MKTFRLFLSPLAGAVVGVIANLALIAALALLMMHTGPWASGKWAVRVEMFVEQAVLFGLSGVAAGALAGWIGGREAGRALGMLAGLLAWAAYLLLAVWQGGAEMIMQAPGVMAALYGTALVATVVGGYLGARVATKPRAVDNE